MRRESAPERMGGDKEIQYGDPGQNELQPTLLHSLSRRGRRRTCPRRSPLGSEPFSRALDFSQEYGDFSIDTPLFSLYKIERRVMFKIFNNIPAKKEAS